MFVFFSFLCSILGILVALKTDMQSSARYTSLFAKAFLFFSLAITICNALVFFGNLSPGITKHTITALFRWGKVCWFLPASVLVGLLYKQKDDFQSHSTNKAQLVNAWTYTYSGVVTMGASFFIFVTIGKARHLTEMKEFFSYSGYSEVFLYFIMVCECLGSLGLFFHRAIKTGVFASLGLFTIMIGAVWTHFMNGDTLENSYDAFTQILILALIFPLFITEKKLQKLNTTPNQSPESEQKESDS